MKQHFNVLFFGAYILQEESHAKLSSLRKIVYLRELLFLAESVKHA